LTSINPAALNSYVVAILAISIVACIIVYLLSPESYGPIELTDLGLDEQREVLRFVYDSYLAKLNMYHDALIGCVFGIFAVVVLLYQDIVNHARFVVLYIGFAFVVLTVALLAFTMTYYGAIQVVEESYKTSSDGRVRMRRYVREGHKQALNVLNQIPFLGQKELTPRFVIIVLSLFRFTFLFPILLLMLMLY
jgi:hypothetical protein